MIEYEQRTELNDADQIAAWQQLSFEGKDEQDKALDAPIRP